jgi:dihydroorotate dehydrogenase
MKSTGQSIADLKKLRIKDEGALQIDFCGISFPNAFCLPSSPVSNTADMCVRAFDDGWGGVVYKTLNLDTEEEILYPSPRLGAVHDLSDLFSDWNRTSERGANYRSNSFRQLRRTLRGLRAIVLRMYWVSL